MELASLEESQQEQKNANVRLKDKVSRLEVMLHPHAHKHTHIHIHYCSSHTVCFHQAQLQTSATESSEVELNLHSEVRSLRSELDEANRKVSRLNQEHRELTVRLQDVEKEKQTLLENVTQLEDTKRRQERSLDKLNKEV